LNNIYGKKRHNVKSKKEIKTFSQDQEKTGNQECNVGKKNSQEKIDKNIKVPERGFLVDKWIE